MKKSRFFIDIDERFKNIKSSDIADIIKKFLQSYNNEKRICFTVRNDIVWHRKYIFLDDEEFKEWKKFQEIANQNKISPKALLRFLIEKK